MKADNTPSTDTLEIQAALDKTKRQIAELEAAIQAECDKIKGGTGQAGPNLDTLKNYRARQDALEKDKLEIEACLAKILAVREKTKRQIEQAWPDPDTLAMLATQARFAKLSDADAVRAALKLRQECLTALDEVKEDSLQRMRKALSLPPPKQWPATLDDFYKVIVRGKDKTENQPRFKDFLRFRAEGRKLDFDSWKRDRHEGFVPDFKPGAGEQWHTQNPEAIDKEVDRQLAEYQAKQFNETEWSDLAREYRCWWHWESTQNKRKAGRKRADKAAAAKAQESAATAPKTTRRKKTS